MLRRRSSIRSDVVVVGERREFAVTFEACMICGRTSRELYFPLEVHEIARGVFRKAAWRERCAWLLLCKNCHAICCPPDWPVVEQLAIKAIKDPEFLNVERLNALRGRAPGAITEDEVWQSVVVLFEANRVCATISEKRRAEQHWSKSVHRMSMEGQRSIACSKPLR